MLSKKARTIKEYAAGEQPGAGYIKLNTNENPYPPGQKTAEVLRGFDAASLRLYPDPDCRGLKEAFARLNEVTPGNIFVGNGSDEVLAFCFPAFYEKDGAPLLMPDVSYSFYPVFCNLFDIPYRRTPVKADFTIDPADYGRDGGQGVVFADPNAPTALGLGLRGIEAILEEFEDKVVIVDEAYADFADYNSSGLLKTYPNLCIVRTMSKSFSLAGLRVGYAMASEELISGLTRIRNCFNSYSVSALAQKAAAAAVEEYGVMQASVAEIKRTRAYVSAELRKVGYTVPDSNANFLFVTHPQRSMPAIFQALRAQKILVRYFAAPRIDDRIRVTVGTPEQMEAFLTAIKAM